MAQYLAALRKLAEKCDFNNFWTKLVCELWNENIEEAVS